MKPAEINSQNGDLAVMGDLFAIARWLSGG